MKDCVEFIEHGGHMIFMVDNLPLPRDRFPSQESMRAKDQLETRLITIALVELRLRKETR